jgi:hypothetical protein
VANPFEDFVQLELGKRPYTNDSGAAEALLVRRGPGPRQLAFFELAEGQVVAKLNGALVGLDISTLGSSGQGSSVLHTHVQSVPASVWDVAHSKSNRYFVHSVYKVEGRAIIPGEVIIVDKNTVSIVFDRPIAGHVVLSFDPAMAEP